jgi:glutamine cyclotransferase
VTIHYKEKDNSDSFDSIVLEIEGTRILATTESEIKYDWDLSDAILGKKHYTVKGYSKDKVFKKEGSFTLCADGPPAEYSYKLINTYPHDRNAYTQGLFYHDGYLYEGTGQRGRSSVRKVNITDGNVIQKTDLSNNYFGEGIVKYKDQIIQITYIKQKAFYYDFETFDTLKEVDYYFSRQGWGLTNIEREGKDLLAFSNGEESKIYFVDPESFNKVGHINVYNDTKKVIYINELENINGKIFANIWQTEKIIEIDPKTGKVTGILNLSELVPKGYENNHDKCLNGIAYNPENNHLYVTGKDWPYLYEIELVKEDNSIAGNQ